MSPLESLRATVKLAEGALTGKSARMALADLRHRKDRETLQAVTRYRVACELLERTYAALDWAVAAESAREDTDHTEPE